MLDWFFDLFKSSEEAWEDAVRRFMATAQGLEDAENAHLQLRPYAVQTGDLAEWDALQDRILYTRQAVTDVSETLRSTSQWFRQTFGLSALNALPLVPIAVITASISAMIAVIYAVQSFNEQVRAKWTYINSHPELTPPEVQAVLESGGADNPIAAFSGAASNAATWLVIGGVVLVALPHVLQAMKEK